MNKLRYIGICCVSLLLLIIMSEPICLPLDMETQLGASFTEINGGFEAGNKDTPFGWSRTSGGSGIFWDWSPNVLRSGNKGISIRVTSAANNTVGWVSDLYPVQRRNIYVEGWILAKNINPGTEVWHTGAIVVQMFDNAQKYIGHNDIVRISGSHNWQKYSSHIYLRQNTAYIKIILGLSLCTGEAWFDDLKLAQLEEEGLFYRGFKKTDSKVAIVPKPMRVLNYSGFVSGRLTDVINLTKLDISSINPEITRVMNGGYAIHQDYGKLLGEGTLRLVLCNPDMFPFFSSGEAGIEAEVNSLGSEGYAIYVTPIKGQPTILLVANNSQGFFYALQTLDQIGSISAAGRVFQRCAIADRPNFKIRAVATGSASTAMLDRMKSLKFNKIIIHSMPGGREAWNQPVSSEERISVKNIVSECEKRFITPNIVIWPGAYGKQMYWTSVEDKQAIVNNILTYRQLGVREFTIFCVSDYVRVGRGDGIVYEKDKLIYKDVADAHIDLIKYLSDAVTQFAPNTKLYVYPFYYYGFSFYGAKELNYLQKLAQLPQEVTFVYSGEMSDAAFILYKTTTKRSPAYRSVYFSKYEMDKPAIIYPFIWDASPGIAGFIEEFVTETPFTDMMFFMAADYAWNPSTYDPTESAFNAWIKSSAGTTSYLRPPIRPPTSIRVTD